MSQWQILKIQITEQYRVSCAAAARLLTARRTGRGIKEALTAFMLEVDDLYLLTFAEMFRLGQGKYVKRMQKAMGNDVKPGVYIYAFESYVWGLFKSGLISIGKEQKTAKNRAGEY